MEGEKTYDLLVAGGGPAGLTAAIYAGRYNMKTLVAAKSFGGAVNLAGEIENWPGFMGPGIELMGKIREQAEKFGAELIETEIREIKKTDGGFVMNLGGREVTGKTLLISLGSNHRELNVTGEKEFLGKGVSYCATCDGNFFRGKKVAVIGGANSAATAAIFLAGVCSEVNIVYRKEKMRCESISLEKLEKMENVKFHYYSNPTEIVGEEVVRKLKIEVEEPEKEKLEKELEVDGVFIEIGSIPATELIKNLGLAMEGDNIKTNDKTMTNIGGVYAAGDITNGPLKQMVTAAAEGAIAVREAQVHLIKKG